MQRAAHDETPLSAACERMHNLANQLVHFSGDSAWPCCIRQLDKKILKKKRRHAALLGRFQSH